MLTEELLLLDLDPQVTPQEELRIRLNLGLRGDHASLDIPVSFKNRRYWKLIHDAQVADAVYKQTKIPVTLEGGTPVATERGLEAIFRIEERVASQITKGTLRGVSVAVDDA